MDFKLLSFRRMPRPECWQLGAISAAPTLPARFVEHRKSSLGERQSKSQRPSFGHHGSKILADRIAVESSRTGFFRLQRKRDSFTSRTQHIWAARRVREHLDQPFLIEIEM